jgi:hypothetical protein
MKLIKLFISVLVIFFLSIFTYSQEEEQIEQEDESVSMLPEGLSLSNQIKYSYDIQKKLEIFEDWFNLDYRYGIFSTGLRFETYEPNDQSFSINRGKTRFSDIAYKYFKVEIGDIDKGLEITAGNFYAMFGRGMILKSFEDRNLRVDNNLLGVKLLGRYDDFILTALTGMPENVQQKRTDILHAFDIEFRGIDKLKLGLSFASNQPENNSARTSLASFRIQPSIWNFDLYAEYGIKQNNDIKENIFKGDRAVVGKAVYGSMNFYYESFSIVGEYKYYDNFGFTASNDMTTIYNMPPAVRKDYTYLLLNRHPSPLDANNEQGYGFEASYNFADESNVTVTYGETKTLPMSSLNQTINGTKINPTVQLKEFYTQIFHHWNDRFTSVLGFSYNEELTNDTRNITPILETRYYFDDINTFRLIVEHQQTKNKTTNEKYFDDVITIEYLRSPKLSVSYLCEIQTKEPTSGKTIRVFWNFLQVGYKFGEHTDVSVLFGSRQAGAICIGGVCRYEPEFRGVELKMLTRF